MKSRLFLLIAIIAMVACQSNDPVERQIDNLLSQMTLEEKIAQMVQINGGQISDSLAQQVRNGAGSMLNSVGAEANHYQRIAVEESRLGIPMIFARDVIHGFRTIFPIPLGQAATFNPAIVEEGARIAAEEAMQAGLRWTFSPMVDVARDPRWGRVAEGYGEDTYLASVMGAAAVRGYQGNDSIVRMAACVKHFAALAQNMKNRLRGMKQTLCRFYIFARRKKWYPERGSNPHVLFGQRILSPLRLPIPPSGRTIVFFFS